MAITGISSYDGKQIIAAGAQSATKAYQDSNGDVITSTYQTTAGMSDYATTASVTGKQDTLTFGYTDNQISQINGSGIYSQGGGGGTSYTGNVQQALDKVYADSATWDDVSAKQDKITFNYDGSDNITGINSSAIGGGGSQVVTATGGTTAYVQTINETPIYADAAVSASFAFYDSNGVFLSSINNSAASGYAASAYLKNSVTGNVANWTDTTITVLNNSGFWGRGIGLYQQDDTPSLTGTAGLGPAGLRFNIGSMISYGNLAYRVIIQNLDKYTSAYNLSFRFQDVVGTQWSQVNNVITVRNGHIIAPYLINIWAGWENEPRIQLVNNSPYATSGPAILRNVRNSTSADNNMYYGNGTIYVANW